MIAGRVSDRLVFGVKNQYDIRFLIKPSAITVCVLHHI